LIDHAVQRRGELADLVASVDAAANGEVAAGHTLGGVGQGP
jgi:hypothetical protein